MYTVNRLSTAQRESALATMELLPGEQVIEVTPGIRPYARCQQLIGKVLAPAWRVAFLLETLTQII
jgi:hypothetical protein